MPAAAPKMLCNKPLVRRCSFSDCSTRSSCSSPADVSILSDVESLEEDESLACVSSDFLSIVTPTSSVGSPRGFLACLFDQCSSCHLEAAHKSSCEANEKTESYSDNADSDSPQMHTRLTSAAPSFQPTSGDSQMDAVTSCVRLALLSCGQIKQVNAEQGLAGSTLISAELSSAPESKAGYQVMQLAKQSLEAITSRFDTMSLLSARIQKEERGYSLRSSIACIPEHAQDQMCWDILCSGHCPRRSTCRWYHPQEADIRRVKVSIKYSDITSESVNEEWSCVPNSQPKKHKISLGELILS